MVFYGEADWISYNMRPNLLCVLRGRTFCIKAAEKGRLMGALLLPQTKIENFSQKISEQKAISSAVPIGMLETESRQKQARISGCTVLCSRFYNMCALAGFNLLVLPGVSKNTLV